MKKCKLLLIAAFSIITFNSFAQTAYEEGKSYASLGYGYQLASRKDFFDENQNAPYYKSVGFGPLLLKYEYALSEKVGIGVSLSYTSANVQWDYVQNSNGIESVYRATYKFTKVTATPRVNFHYGESEKIDFYTGFGVGIRRLNNALSSTEPGYQGESIKQLIPVSLEISQGVRFLFTEQIGAFVEVGIGPAFGQFGVVAKF